MLKELFVPLVAGTIVTAMLFLANELIAVFQKLNLNNVPPEAIAKYIILLIPTYLKYTIPMGVAMGSALAISRITRDGELTAMRTAGFPIRRVMRMVFVVGALFGVASYFNMDVLIPRAEKQKIKLANELNIVAILPQFERNKAIQLPPYVALFGEVAEKGETMVLKDILLFERQKAGEFQVYIAPEGTYEKGVWTIKKPRVRMFQDDAFVDIYDVDEVVINQRIDIQDFMVGGQVDAVASVDLIRRIDEAKRAGGNTRNLELPLYERQSISFACVIFAAMAGVLAIRFSKGSAFQGLLMSLLFLWIFFNFHIVMTSIVGKNGWLPPAVAAWSPTVIFGLVTAYIGWKQE